MTAAPTSMQPQAHPGGGVAAGTPQYVYPIQMMYHSPQQHEIYYATPNSNQPCVPANQVFAPSHQVNGAANQTFIPTHQASGGVSQAFGPALQGSGAVNQGFSSVHQASGAVNQGFGSAHQATGPAHQASGPTHQAMQSCQSMDQMCTPTRRLTTDANAAMGGVSSADVRITQIFTLMA